LAGIYQGVVSNYVYFFVYVLFLLIILFQKTFPFRSSTITLLIVGTTLNLFERMVFGKVCDYFSILNTVFFNFYDICILLGIIFVAYELTNKNKGD
jgi:lipoprotein signal peptidase